jgi:secondary thiamine-phosphate synthase enzyme
MILKQYQLHYKTPGRGFIDVTEYITKQLKSTKIQTGLCHVFLHHTSASLVICENADELVQRDLEAFMSRAIPDGDPLYEHVDEGPDDMPSHVRTMLTQSFQVIPITNHTLALGRWQGIYIWEHRLKSHERRLTITIQGE